MILNKGQSVKKVKIYIKYIKLDIRSVKHNKSIYSNKPQNCDYFEMLVQPQDN